MAGDDEDDGEMEALREALRQQSLAVEMLKAELEEERQAASSGADEALAMILRLQGEKAAVRMEADQFRRVAEEWVRSNVSHHALPRLHRSSSHRLPRAPSYSAQCGIPNVHDKFEAPESVASHAPPRSSRRSSPEIISEEDDVISSSTRRGDCNDPKPSDERANGAIADLGAGIDEIKSSVQTLATELSRTRQTSMSRGDAQMQVLAEICAKLDAMRPMSKQQNAVHGGNKHSSREVGSSSKVVVAVPQSELLMDHFIEAMMYIP